MEGCLESRLSTLQPPPVVGPPRAGRAALLLLNWQVAYLAAEGELYSRARRAGLSLGGWERACGEARERAGRLLAAAREAGLDIVHCRTATHLPGGADATVRSLPLPAQHETGAAFMEEFEPAPGEPVITATSHSPFNSTRLDTLLRNLGVEQLLLAGLPSHRAIDLTASDARDRGYEVVVIEDACFTLSGDLHRAAMGRLRAASIPTAGAEVAARAIAEMGEWPTLLEQGERVAWPLAADPWARLFPAGEDTAPPLSASALITVDMQYLNAHPDWGAGRAAREAGLPDFDDYFREVAAITPRLREVQEAFRRAGRPLIHLRTACHRPDHSDSGRHRRTNRAPMAALGTRETGFLEEVAPLPGEIVINKSSWGAFNSTAIERILRNLAARHLVMVGVVTNGCVELTARDALDRGFQVTVIEDATTTRTPALHDDALARLRAEGAATRTSAACLAWLAGREMPLKGGPHAARLDAARAPRDGQHPSSFVPEPFSDAR